MIKRGVSRFEPVVDPMQREQLNMLDIKNVGDYINQVKIKLTEKLNIFDTILHTSNLFGPDIAANIDKISNYISDMIDFNKIIQVYLNPSNTPQTRQEIMNKITQFKPNFEKLQKLTEDLLKKMITEDKAPIFNKFFVKSLRPLALYDLVVNQFKTNRYFAITEKDIEDRMMSIISQTPSVSGVIQKYNLSIKAPPAPPLQHQ
jgi:hypothetical protein